MSKGVSTIRQIPVRGCFLILLKPFQMKYKKIIFYLAKNYLLCLILMKNE